MWRTRALLLVAGLLGCSGESPPAVDANPLGPRCSANTYDLCSEEHDCASMVCQNFAAQGLQVCSVACTPQGPACPTDATGAPGTCDGNACRPAMANLCHL